MGQIISVYGDLLLTAMGQTLLLALCGLFFACILGLIFGMMSVLKSRVCNIIAAVFVDIIRGVPMIVLAFFVYFGVPMVINDLFNSGFTLSPLQAGTICLALNCGAYMAEIIRGGIQSVDKGQMEAGRSLGLNKLQTMRYIIIPQAFKSILPPLGNEFIVLIKETSIVGYVGMSDLTRVANQMTSKLFDVFTPLLGIAFIYFVLTKVLSILLAKLERRLRKSDNR